MENSDDLNTIDLLVQRARTAQSSYEREGTQELFDLAAQAVGWALMKPEHNTALAELAVKETGLGNVSDKIKKNHNKDEDDELKKYTNKLINQVVDEFFPGAYHGKNAVTNFRNDMVVKSFIQHLKSVGEFDGQEKFDKVLDQFTKGKLGDFFLAYDFSYNLSMLVRIHKNNFGGFNSIQLLIDDITY